MSEPLNNPFLDYLSGGSEEAFRQVVHKHVDAVYSQCLRQLRDPGLAEEVTQNVFVTLAQKARRLPKGVVLDGWLFQATRYLCLNARRTEVRRQKREQRAARMRQEAVESVSDDGIWQQAEPMLDDAIAGLSSRDRDALLLRFFQGLTAREVGAAMGISENAAKQRVSRAVDKLRVYFGRRGLAMPSAAITACLSSAVKPAGPGLAQAAVHTTMASVAAKATSPVALASWYTAAAALVVTGAIATSVVLVQQPKVSAQTSSPSPATEPARAPSRPLDQVTPLNALAKLSAGIEGNDRLAIIECLCDDGKDPEQAGLMRAALVQDAATARLRRTWAAKLKAPMQLQGMSLDANYGDICRLVVETARESDVRIDGETASVRITLPPEVFAGTGPTRSVAQERWSGALLMFNRVDGKWKLNTDRTFNPIVDVGRKPGNEVDAIVIERQISEFLADAINEVAANIENGTVSTAEEAASLVRDAGRRSCINTGVNGDNMTVLPVIGG